MKAKVHHDLDDERAEGKVRLTIETAEDLQVAQDRCDVLKKNTKDKSETDELRSLEAAIASWHRKQSAA